MVPQTSPKQAADELAMVVIQFRAGLTRAELVTAFTPDAPMIAQARGLRWKYWTLDEATRSFAGIYLFESRRAADAYASGPVPEALRKSPHLSDVRVNVYDVLGDLSRRTRAPLDAMVGAKAVRA